MKIHKHNSNCNTSPKKTVNQICDSSDSEFEDFEENQYYSEVLKSTHGTGNVTKQIMQMKEAESVIKIKCDSENAICVKPWSKLKVFNNCEVAGKLIGINADEQYNEEFLQLTNAKNICSIKKVTRVLLNGQKLYSEMYTRMKKRNCNYVLLKDGGKAMMKFFIVNVEVNDVYAAVTLLEDSSSSLDELEENTFYQSKKLVLSKFCL